MELIKVVKNQSKEYYVNKLHSELGGQKTYWTQLSKEQLVAVSTADPKVREVLKTFASSLKQRALVNQKVNQNRFAQEQIAKRFERQTKKLIQANKNLTDKFDRLVEQLVKDPVQMIQNLMKTKGQQ